MADKRLIDSNALVCEIAGEYFSPRNPSSVLTELGMEIANAAIDRALIIIHNAPTINAVEVVRCEDCVKFWEYTEEHKATVEKADGDCMIRCMSAPDDLQFCAVQKDDYCSMGKRKEE